MRPRHRSLAMDGARLALLYLVRRDLILQHAERLIDEHGAAKVLYP